MFKNLLKKLARALVRSRIPYMVIGGQAVLLYGEPRLTKDIDLTLGVRPERLNQVIKLLIPLKVKILVEDPEEFVARTMVLPVLDVASGIRVDFIFSDSPYERQAIRRAVDVRFGTTKISFASIEDVIIHKIFAGRPRDLEDVQSILLKNQKHNTAYIRRWLKKLGEGVDSNFLSTFEVLLKEIR